MAFGLAAFAGGAAGGAALAAEKSPEAKGKPSTLLFFFSPNCRACDEVTELVKSMETRYGDRLRVFYKNLTDPKRGVQINTEYLAILNRFKVEDTPTLTVVVDMKVVLPGHEEIVKRLAEVLAERLGEPSKDAEADDGGAAAANPGAKADGGENPPPPPADLPPSKPEESADAEKTVPAEKEGKTTPPAAPDDKDKTPEKIADPAPAEAKKDADAVAEVDADAPKDEKSAKAEDNKKDEKAEAPPAPQVDDFVEDP